MLRFSRWASWMVSAAWLCACLPDSRWKHDGPTVPEALDDGWEIATPESVGLDARALDGIHAELLREDRHFTALAFLVVKDGKLVYETYLRGLADRDHVQHIQSATKSVTSLAFGLARGDGALDDLDATLADFFPEKLEGLDPRKRKITLRHLLTMRSELAFENDVFAVELQVDRPRDPLRYILKKRLYDDPGKEFRYRDADPQLISYVIQTATGDTEEALVRERIFRPLGIRDYHWEAAPDGATLGAHGLHLRPRDFAKLGQMILDGCARNGEPIVPAEWCSLATTQHVSPRQTGGATTGRGYGYYFWTLESRGAYAAWGHGGQYLLMVPAQRLLLVQVALPDADSDLHGGDLNDFVELTEPLLDGQITSR